MTTPSQPTPPSPRPRVSLARWWVLALVLPLAAGIAFATRGGFNRPAEGATARTPAPRPDEDEKKREDAPELAGGVAWLNTAGPIRLKDLKGKIVVLDFWTLCCINCIHTIPDLAKLEKKYAKELVVIGVHSPKFDNERSTESIRKAVLRYEVTHPVVNDADRKIWEAYHVDSWPTLYLIDPEGKLVARGSGEGLYEALDKAITDLIKEHKAKKTLNERPLKFELARNQENGTSPLFFPGKVLADGAGKRLFIADSTHHRVVVTDLDGRKLAIAGTGEPGATDGDFAKAQFDDPQGMALKGDVLYVADRKNHLIRALDLKARTVKTVAGTGKQGQSRRKGGPALETGLNSPWDLLFHGETLYIAMAGSHQIWALDLAKKELTPFAGSGFEMRSDGTLGEAAFAQPSGLTSDGKRLFVADSEVSSVRTISLDDKGEVGTLVGQSLFEFGDADGEGDKVRLQHALGVVWVDGKVYVADTYNSKVKVLDPEKRECRTLVGGEPEGWLGGPVLSEPAGISYALGKLYVADTNAHRIRVIDLKTRAVSTLKLQGVEAPQTGMRSSKD